MTVTWRALPGLVLAAALLAPVAPASAWSCTYYKWNAADRRWERVALLQPEQPFETQYPKPYYWQCRYCYVPVPVPGEDPGPELPAEVQELLDDVNAAANKVLDGGFGTLGADPFNGPDCPDVPPVWDEP